MSGRVLAKLCGLRTQDDARAAVVAGADLVGIVLVPGARRCVSPLDAAALIRAVRCCAGELGRTPPEIVGVVGPMSADAARELVMRSGVDTVQLVGHDDACEELAQALAGRPIIRSIGVAEAARLEELRSRTERWERRGARVVYDAQLGEELGGTGTRIRADIIGPLLAAGRHGLAGGLDPHNVAAAIRDLRPVMVDVSSGIESHPGHKDPELMRAFVAACRAASTDAHANPPEMEITR